jgi:hypothetical protein
MEINDETVGRAADVEALLTRSSERWSVVFKRKGRVRRVELTG